MKLEIKDLSKQFNDIKAVDSINFSMEKGVYGLLGANGAGKTTLMRMMCTLLTPSSGTISFDGESILKLGESYREILGYLPQDFGYYPEFSAEDYLLYIASLKGIKRVYAKKRAEELLKKVSLWDVRKKKIKKFSGGMKRRLGIAQAVLNNPQILILDEPTAGLDPKERIRFRNLISSLAEDRIILLSTHIVSDLQSIANRIFIMKTGNISAEGTAEELINKVDGYVWRCEIDSQEAEKLQEKYIISNLKSEGNQVELRIISEEKPTENAVYEKPTLEDLFMYYFGEAEKDDVSI
ncbi:ABC transporter ATP-binding protein [Clostridium oryzae]|uniref:Putative ABC transporter ATP-binding protein YxlF n=1 Tax=Clostridium oryzae TaxID=1450648 RepID=A0A1V4ING7_9CLOT|nr:ABC transporter ATP-binding protein [Clostridium oryzae]OPJ61443.1 putative ABC transporter ATP-binding protein YxlF [Clostridium oryzae]